MDYSQADFDDTAFILAFGDESATDPCVTGGKGANLARLVDAPGVDVPAGFSATTDAYRSLVTDPETRRAVEAVDELDPTTRTVSATWARRYGNGFETRPFRRTSGTPSKTRWTNSTRIPCPFGRVRPPRTFRPHRSPGSTRRISTSHPTTSSTGCAIAWRACTPIERSRIGFETTFRAQKSRWQSSYRRWWTRTRRESSSPRTRFRRTDAWPPSRRTTDSANPSSPGKCPPIRFVSTGSMAPSYHTMSARKRFGCSLGTKAVSNARPFPTMPEDLRALSSEQVHHLVERGEEIEELFGEPQDIEWAFRDGQLFVLQSRPITSLFPLISPRPEDDLLHVYMSFGHQQAMPEALPPLVVDFWRSSTIDGGVERFLPPESGGLSAEAGGRVYVDLTPLVRLAPFRQRVPNALSFLSEPASDGLREVLRDREADLPERGRVATWVRALRAIRRGSPSLRPIVSGALSRFTSLARVRSSGPRRTVGVERLVGGRGRQANSAHRRRWTVVFERYSRASTSSSS